VYQFVILIHGDSICPAVLFGIRVPEVVNSLETFINYSNGPFGFLGLAILSGIYTRAVLLLTTMALPVNDWVLQEGFQNRQERVAVVTKSPHGCLEPTTVQTISPGWTESILHVCSETKWNHLRPGQVQSLIEDAVDKSKQTKSVLVKSSSY
jgi:hypothetical protein